MKLPPEMRKFLESQGLSLSCAQILEELADPKLYSHLEQYRKALGDAKVFWMDVTPTHFLSLSVSSDLLTGRLTLIGFQTQIPRLHTLLDGALAAKGLVKDKGAEARIESWAGLNFKESPPIESTIVKGVAPFHAQPPTIKLLVEPFIGKPRYTEDEEGNINYHELNLFQNVVQNQPIANAVQPVPGRPGRDVFGRMMAAGEAKQVPVQCGAGAVFDEQQGKYFAAHSGYVVFEDHRLRVEKIYEIRGSVDLSVGHVNFISDVVVHGDVLPDFNVRAGGRLAIHGAVTGAKLVCEGDLQMSKGVMGQGKSRVRSGGKVMAKFLNDCVVEAGDSIVLSGEALNSKIFSLGDLEADRAVLIGGRIVVLGSMKVGTFGSELGLKTEVFLGEDYRTLNRTETVRDALLTMRERVELLLRRYHEEIAHWQSPHEQIVAAELNRDMERLEELLSLLGELKILSQEYELLSSRFPEGRNPKCRVNKAIHPGTIFFSSGVVIEVKENIRGPVMVEERKDRNGKVFLDIIPQRS